LYGAAAFGDFTVNRTTSPASSRWVALVLIAGTLALAGCGRKGGLDLPPNAPPQPTASAAETEAETAANKGTLFNPSYGSDTPPAATKGTKRPFVLDPLLKD
jgi:predicted small lipoprotein YifL